MFFPFIVCKGESNRLDLVGSLFVGSVDYMDPYLKLPSEVWTASLRYGFVGCLKDLFINGAPIDIVTYAHQQDVGKHDFFPWTSCNIYQFNCKKILILREDDEFLKFMPKFMHSSKGKF